VRGIRDAVLLVLFALMGSAAGGPRDETHPRAPDQPLPIEFTPWHCQHCIEQELLKAQPRDVLIMARRAPVFAKRLKIRRSWFVIESPNFKVFSTLAGARINHGDSRFAAADLVRLKTIFPDFNVGGQGSFVTPHQRAHLYQIRVERILSHLRALTGNKRRFLGMGDRFELFLFEKEKEFQAFVEKELAETYSVRTPVQRKHFIGGDNFYVVSTAASLHKGGERELNNMVLHHMAHGIVNGHNDYVSKLWGWLDGGFAHYYERRESVKHNFFCREGQDPPKEFIRGNWLRKIRHIVYRKKDVSLGLWCDKVYAQQLSGVEHAMAWSIVEWLVRTDPVRLAKLMDIAALSKDRPSSSQAIEQVFGVGPYELHERWRAYVLKEY
jgi:hypothetical protein